MSFNLSDGKITYDEFAELSEPMELDLEAMYRVGMEEMISEMERAAADGEDIDQIVKRIVDKI